MLQQNYLDFLAEFGVGGAHPGGLKLTKHLLRSEKLKPSTQILDAGCGTGQTIAFLYETYQCKITALDKNKTMIQKAKNRLNSQGIPADYILGDIQNLPFIKDSFDLVLCESVLAFTDVRKSLKHCHRVLNDKGVLLAIEMVLEKEILDEELNRLSDFYGIPTFFKVPDWVKHIKKAGFTNVMVQQYNPEYDEHDDDNATDFSMSESMDEQLFDVLEQHENYMKKYKDALGFRIFRATI